VRLLGEGEVAVVRGDRGALADGEAAVAALLDTAGLCGGGGGGGDLDAHVGALDVGVVDLRRAAPVDEHRGHL
jgi:hypothetical protein